MNVNDLYIEYARVIEMCKGTALENEPWKCVRFNRNGSYRTPNNPVDMAQCIFNNQVPGFAVAVLEDEPVFVGDVIYNIDGTQAKVELYDKESVKFYGNWWCLASDFNKYFTWTPPATKRTFTISVNGGPHVALPCPVNGIDDPAIYIRKGDGNGIYFQFYSVVDRDKVCNALINLLTEERDK